MKRLAIPGLIALSVLLVLACSLTSGVPTEEIRRRAIAILGDDVEEELVRDFIVVTPPPTFTVTPTPPPCINPISFGTYHLSVFNDQSGTDDNPQLAYGPPDGQNSRWEGNSDVTRYWSYSLASVISGLITHTLVYTPEGTVSSVDLYVHRERFVSVEEPGWVRVCTGLWSCSFTSEVGSLMYALSGPSRVQVDGAMLELTNGCEYAEAEVVAAANTPTLTPTGTPTATIESSSESPPTAESGEEPTEAPTESATAVPPLGASPTLQPSPTLLPSPTFPPPPTPTPTFPPPPTPTPTFPPPPTPTAPPSSPPTDTPTDTPTPVPLPVVAFSAASYSITENGGAAIITVILNKTTAVSVTVDYATSDGTATAGSDYTASSGTLTFLPGQTSLSLPVPILDDGSVEGDETVNLTLSNPGNATLGSPSAATLTIVEDDVPTVQFSSATYSVDEFAGTAAITVTLNVASVQTITVDYTTNDITPLSNTGIENGLTSWTVVDQAGGSGSWFVQTGTTSPSPGGCCAPTTVPASTQGSQAAMSAQDGPGSHVLYQDFVVPNAPVTLNFDLYLLNRASAWVITPTLDYSGSPNQQVRVDIMNTTAPITDVGAGVLLNVYQTNVGDSLSTTTYIPVTADLSSFAGQTVRLRFAEVDNQLFLNAGVDNVCLESIIAIPTPESCSDYTPTSGTLTFAPGQTVANFNVPIINDSTVELNETVNLSLSAPVNATLGTPNTAVLTIQNDD